jgi:hypothetical protein
MDESYKTRSSVKGGDARIDARCWRLEARMNASDRRIEIFEHQTSKAESRY